MNDKGAADNRLPPFLILFVVVAWLVAARMCLVIHLIEIVFVRQKESPHP
jgi:hypothetical protein